MLKDKELSFILDFIKYHHIVEVEENYGENEVNLKHYSMLCGYFNQNEDFRFYVNSGNINEFNNLTKNLNSDLVNTYYDLLVEPLTMYLRTNNLIK